MKKIVQQAFVKLHEEQSLDLKAKKKKSLIDFVASIPAMIIKQQQEIIYSIDLLQMVLLMKNINVILISTKYLRHVEGIQKLTIINVVKNIFHTYSIIALNMDMH